MLSISTIWKFCRLVKSKNFVNLYKTAHLFNVWAFASSLTSDLILLQHGTDH